MAVVIVLNLCKNKKNQKTEAEESAAADEAEAPVEEPQAESTEV